MALDLVMVLLVALGFVLGFFRGAIRQLTSIGAWLVSFLLAANAAIPLGNAFYEQTDVYSLAYSHFLAFLVLFVALLTIGAVLFQIAGSNTTLTRNVTLDGIIGGVLGGLLVVLVATSLIVILDSYHAGEAVPGTEFGVLRDVYGLTLESAFANTLRETLIPLLGALFAPILPAGVRAVMS